jgi:hypothetical protein
VATGEKSKELLSSQAEQSMSLVCKRAYLAMLIVLLLPSGIAWAQAEIARPTAGDKNAIGLSAALGAHLTQDNYAYAVTAQYDRALTRKWDFAISLGAVWMPPDARKVEQGIAVGINGGYSLTDRLSAELAYSKEFARFNPQTNYSWQ